MKVLSGIKRIAFAGIAAGALIGPVTSAHALQFANGDAILAVYANGTEYARDLGSFSSVITNGVNLDLSSIISQVSGPNTLNFAIFGANSSTDVFFGSRSPLADWTTQNKNAVLPNTLFSNTSGWGTLLANASDARNFFPQADPLSFSTNMNASGANTLGGSVPAARGGFAQVGDVMHLFTRTGGPTSLTEVGIATFSANGQLQIGPAPVPVPAAVVLFATGIIGLVGLARRRMSGTHKDTA